MALSGIDAGTARGLIHHSDRGCQYCSDAYVSELKKWGIHISMTQSGDPLENAVAERANGIPQERMALQDVHPGQGNMQGGAYPHH